MALTRTKFVVAGASGRSYRDVPEELRSVLAELITAGTCTRTNVLKAERVWRWNEWVIKRSLPASWAQRWVRRSSASRAAEAALCLERLGTPQPLLALERRRTGRLRDSWLVSEFVDGLEAARAVERHPRAEAALSDFMAAMHTSGVMHGDLNHRNLLWNGARWMLIDLEALRGPLHRLRVRRIAEEQWAHLSAAMKPIDRLRPSFVDYAARMGRTDVDRAWSRIQAQAAEFFRRRQAWLARHGLPLEADAPPSAS